MSLKVQGSHKKYLQAPFFLNVENGENIKDFSLSDQLIND